ncbi:hypothetical protein [Hymenobacter volaticus]|uniref:Uncharacterized protein n=1 Tax=Hymenobacter volaticus TaxID=2932254 RepID=A0ABY4G1W4_9BACT|nr:hypothetical protein [Hymenobacter volaticus]UOQ64860.1 hypothetical protein MUN86_14955 [Hymenobacter volaticus]
MALQMKQGNMHEFCEILKLHLKRRKTIRIGSIQGSLLVASLPYQKNSFQELLNEDEFNLVAQLITMNGGILRKQIMHNDNRPFYVDLK